MSSLDKLIRFDRQGVCGPALSLIALAGKYHPKELVVAIKILQENAEKIAHTSLRGRKEFIQLAQAGGTSLTVVQILSTRFFQGLQAQEPLPPTYLGIKQTIAPKILMEASNCILELQDILAQEETKEALIDWLAKVLSRYKTEQQVRHECLYEQLVAEHPEISLQHRECDRQIYEAAKNKEIAVQQFNAIIWALESGIENGSLLALAEWYLGINARAGDAEALKRVLMHVRNYLDLFFMAGEENADWFCHYVRCLLVKSFKEDFFPETSESLFLPTGLLGPAGIALSLLYQANSLSIEQLTTAAKAVKRTYTVMTGQEIHGRKLFCQMFEVARQEGREVSWEGMLSSRMFVEMRPEQIDDELHRLTMKWLVPYSYDIVAYQNSQLMERLPRSNDELAKTLARLIESFMSAEHIKVEQEWFTILCILGSGKKRLEPDAMVYKAAWEGKLDEQDLNLLVRSLEKRADVWGEGAGPQSNLECLLMSAAGVPEDKQALLTEIVAKYQQCLGKGWSRFREHTVRMLDIYLRETFFAGSLAISRY